MLSVNCKMLIVAAHWAAWSQQRTPGDCLTKTQVPANP